MKKLFYPTQSPLWFVRNHRTLLYFFRELTGVVIAIYCVYFAANWYLDASLSFIQTSTFWGLSLATFIASLLHSITWFWVTTQVTPQPLPKWAELILFFVLCGVALGLTFVLFYLFYS